MKHFFTLPALLLLISNFLWSNGFPTYFVTLRQDDLDDRLSQTEINDFWAQTKLIKQLNDSSGKNLLYPIPQALDAFEVISWFNFSQAGAAILPVPLYKLLSDAGLLTDYELLGFSKANPAYLATIQRKGFDCAGFSLEQHRFKPNDIISFPNEYHNSGFLLYSSLAKSNPSLNTADVYFFQDTHDQKAQFKKDHPTGAQVFGFFSEDELKDLKKEKNICLLSSGLTTPISDYFLIANRTLKLSVPEILGWKKLDPSEVERKIKAINTYYQQVSVLPRLTYKNVRQRLKDNLGENYLALAFMGGGARTPYTFRFGNEFFYNILEDQKLSQKTVLIGISGGAINSLILSILEPNVRIPEKSVGKLANMGRYIRPEMRSQMIALMVQYPRVFFGAIGLILAYLLVLLTHLLFTPKRLNAIWKLLVLSTMVIGMALVPNIQLEYAPPLLIILFVSQFMIHFLLRRHQPAFIINLVSITIFIVLVAGFIKTPFHQKNLFDRFDMPGFMHDFLVDIQDKSCGNLTNREELSRCLYQKVHYPLVITASNSETLQRVNFYISPEKSPFAFPKRIDWINLASCPERLLDVLEASASVPMIFAPISVQCGANDYRLVDGGVLSALPLVQANDLNINYQFLFWNSLIDVKSDFIGILTANKPVNIIDQVIFYWTLKIRQAINRNIVQNALKQTFFISVPNMELIEPGDFWGGTLGNGQFALPAELSPIATSDFFSKPGVFTELAGGDLKPDAFWNHFRIQLEE